MILEAELKLNKQLVILIGIFYALCLLFSIFFSPREIIWIGLILLITYFALYFVKPLFGFIIIVSEALLAGFITTGAGFHKLWTLFQQVELIKRLSIFNAAVGVIWLTIVELKEILEQVKEISQLLKKLAKYEREAAVLTLNEFLYQAEHLHTAMQRRSETGFFLIITIRPGNRRFALPTLFSTISHAAVLATRKKYDLVAKLSEEKLIIMLQNTGSNGCQIVVDRLVQLLHRNINIPVDMYWVVATEVPATWRDVAALLAQGEGIDHE